MIQNPYWTYYTDNWSIYSELIPPHQHVKGKSHTCRIESSNSDLRHYSARFTHKTKVVSRSQAMVDKTLRLFMIEQWLQISVDLKSQYLNAFM